MNEKRILEVLNNNDIASLRKWYKLTIDEKIKEGKLVHQEYWSRSVAVGEVDWLESISGSMGMKRFKIQGSDPNNLQSDFYIGRY